MKYLHLTALTAALVLPQALFAEDKPVKEADLPPAVAKAIKEATAGAKLDKIETENEHGKTVFEAAWKAGGRKHEVSVSPNGKVVATEVIIPLAEAPEAVRAAIAKEEGGKDVKEVEQVQADGKTKFEADFKSASFKGEIVFSESGKVLEREKAGAEKDEKKDKKD